MTTYLGATKIRIGKQFRARMTDQADRDADELQGQIDKCLWLGTCSTRDKAKLIELQRKQNTAPKAEHILTHGVHVDEILTPPISIRGLGGIRLA